jgi:hypothetical protein
MESVFLCCLIAQKPGSSLLSVLLPPLLLLLLLLLLLVRRPVVPARASKAAGSFLGRQPSAGVKTALLHSSTCGGAECARWWRCQADLSRPSCDPQRLPLQPPAPPDALFLP